MTKAKKLRIELCSILISKGYLETAQAVLLAKDDEIIENAEQWLEAFSSDEPVDSEGDKVLREYSLETF